MVEQSTLRILSERLKDNGIQAYGYLRDNLPVQLLLDQTFEALRVRQISISYESMVSLRAL